MNTSQKGMTSRAAVALTVVMVLAGCAGSSNVRPAWVDGSDAHYKPALYLTGRGQADSQVDAEDRARADLAKVFQVQVDVQSQDVLAYKSGAAAGRTTSSVTRTLVTKTDQIIKGIQIPELWRDPETKSYYALAVLPRMQAANSLRQEVEARDGATDRYIRASRATDDLLLKIAAADRALEAQVERSAYQKTLKVVDVSGVGVPPPWNIATLRVDLDELLHRLRIAPEAAAAPLPGLQDDLAGGLSAAGFLVDTGKDPDYVLKASLDVTEPELLEDWYWIRGTLYVQLINPANGQVRGTRQWDVKVSARQPAITRQRLQTRVRDIFKHDIRETLIDFAVNSGEAS
jgi:hypothetical protein